MLEAARRLKPGGLAIVTLKISPHEPLKTVSKSLRTLERAYEIFHARQLRHNRNETRAAASRRPFTARESVPASDRPRRTGLCADLPSPGHAGAVYARQ